ncbi:MAG: hypothetical protein ACLSAH_04830 [Bilophila wadsworthia]
MRTLLMLPLLLLPFTAQAASLLPGGDYPAPDCRSPRCGLCPATARWTGGCTARHGSLSPVRGGVSRHCPAGCGSVSANGWKKPCASTMKSQESVTVPSHHAHLPYGGPLRRGAINAERRSSFSEAPRI